MSIIEEIRIALLDLFPEQAAAEAEARVLAAAHQAEIDAAAAEMESIDLTETPAGEVDDLPIEEEFPVPVEKSPALEAKAAAEKPEEEGPRENGVLLTDHVARGTAIDVLCDPEQVVDAARIMDEAKFFLESIAGVDWIKEKKMEVIYDYNQYGKEPCRVVVRTFIDRENPEIETISNVFPSANWHERETHDFYGIQFQGHPYLVPLLLPEDADFYPLLKDFKP